MRLRHGLAIGMSAWLLLTGCEALTARKYLATPSAQPTPSQEVQLVGQSFRTLDDARAADVSAERFIVSDDTIHVEFVRDLEQPDLTTIIGENTYGVKFTTEVPMLAFDIEDDATEQLQEGLELAAKLKLGLTLSKNQSYVVTDELKIPRGVPYVDGRGSEMDVNIQAEEGDERSALSFAPLSKGVKISNIVLNMDNSTFTRGIFGDAIEDSTISKVVMNGVNFRGIELLSQAGALKNVRVENNRIDNTSTKDGALSIVVDAGSGGYHNTGLRIVNNTVSGGYHGVSVSGVSNSVISGNNISGNARNISLHGQCNNNVVEDNQLSHSVAAAVHIADDSDNNQVKNNTINSDVAQGESLLQAQHNSNGNDFSGNSVTVQGDAQPNWILYVDKDSADTKFQDNTVDGATRSAVVGVESQTPTTATSSTAEPTATTAPSTEEPTPGN